ncbi:hypothetical protein [Mitsuokella jalaludinii]|uniref:hypothetical protein n=1 Tax=Mitsuokella jalaludinii TaxID=187979 RepID=UPI003F9AAE92
MHLVQQSAGRDADDEPPARRQDHERPDMVQHDGTDAADRSGSAGRGHHSARGKNGF